MIKYYLVFLFLAFINLSCEDKNADVLKMCDSCNDNRTGKWIFGNGTTRSVEVYVDNSYMFTIRSGDKRATSCISEGFHSYRAETIEAPGTTPQIWQGTINVEVCTFGTQEIENQNI